MMKNFPRIYSLSTVGLIHHQEFDYLFHPFRTDFIGESGVGKSMIADLIQLIFVGSEVFESATKGNDKRDPDGMVLTEQKRGKGVGYAFLNIQKSPREWLVVGVYLESGVQHSQAFLIQQGFDWEHPLYLPAPLGFKHFLRDDQILPIEQLKDLMGNQGFYCTAWQRYRKFHEVLFSQNILPLNVSTNHRLLKDYAAILQAFSRGKMLDTRSSDSLCQFLFGNEIAQNIWLKFLDAVKEMENSVGEYGQNLNEIQRVTAKQKALVKLREQKRERDEFQQRWLLQELRYWHQETSRLERERRECALTYLKAKQYKDILDDILIGETLATKEKFQALCEELSHATKIYEDLLPRYSNFESARTFRQSFKGSDGEFRKAFDAYQEKRHLTAALQDLENRLNGASVMYEISAISTQKSLFNLQGDIKKEIDRVSDELDTKKILKSYVLFTDPSSLSYWALQQNRAFNLEEESAFLAFQHLPRNKPTDKKDYLPTPAQLIDALSVVEKEDDGFWINLNGIRRFVRYTTTPILQTNDQEKIRSYFKQYSNQLDQEVAELSQRKNQLESILRILSEIPNPALALNAFWQKKQLLKQETIAEWNISAEAFEEKFALSLGTDNVSERFKKAKQEKDSISVTLEQTKALLSTLEHFSKQYINKKQAINVGLLQPADFAGELMTPELERQNIVHRLAAVQNQDTLLGNELETTNKKLETIVQLPKLTDALNEIGTKRLAAEKRFLSFNETLPADLTQKEHITGFSAEHSDYLTAETDYVTKFRVLVQHYLSAEAYRFEGASDFVELATHLLPEAFRDTILGQSESSVIEAIENYLTRINEKNRQLNSRKVQKIKTLLDEVDEAITHQENTARRIDIFLRNAAKISGGYTARLRKGQSAQYPKTWITTFKDMLDDKVQADALHHALGDKIDLPAMMKEAFVRCTNTYAQNFTIKNLLDPSKYIELSFNLESDTGRINKGSTGQTYTAVAMLCIARLSIMSSEEGKQPTSAVRVMPIDEAEGLGSNYDMLYEIAQRYDYQLLSLSVNPVGKFKDGEQYVYMLHKNMETEAPVNGVPMAVLCDLDKQSIENADDQNGIDLAPPEGFEPIVQGRKDRSEDYR